MNRHAYRLVFNAARGCVMAVCEAAQRGGKGPITTLGLAVGRDRMARLARVSLALTGLSAALVQAQIIADPSAPGNQRPTVLAAPNGVPLVNIQTPSAAGVSRNTYQQFDVGTPGAVLNNSRTNAPTQLGGWVQGNPWLAAGEARVILNEVNSHHPSHLNGFVEVAGQRAEVIIANPAGIQVNGGGFINASRATLTTGTPVMNGGHLESFRVQRGTVRIDGAGLNTAHSDYTAILARAIEVNARLHAQQLHLVAGANTVDAQHHHVQTGAAPDPQGPMPSFALDVSELGGMYAGHIRLIGTEAGVGVRHHGTLAASAGDVHISTQGWLSSAGRIEAAQHLMVQAQEVTHRGLTDSAHTHIQATTLDNVGTGRIFGDRVAIAAHTLTNREDTGDGVTAPDARAAAVIAARERLDIGVQHLTNQEGALLFSAGDLAIGGALDAYRHAITDGSAHAQTLNNHSATIESLGHMALAADVLRNTNAHFHTELALISGPESLTLIQPQGSSSRIPTSLLRVHHFSNAWGYVFNTDPDPVQASVALLGQTPIPGVGEETCTDWNDASTCSRLPGADYLPDDPAWAYFGLTPPLPEPVAPVLPPPQVPVLDPLADPEAYDAAWAYYQAEQAAYSAAWDAYHAVHAQWDALTEDLYETLDQRITDYNRQFASILITHWTQYNITSTEHESQVTQSAPGQILAGGHLSLRGQDLLNDKSRIIAGLSLQGDLNNLENRQALGHNVVNETGTTQSSWTYTRRGGFFRTGSKRTHRDFSGHSPYNPPDVVTSINLNVAEIQQYAAIPTAPSIVLPVSSLFSIQPDSAARFVVETDPRFTHYRQWLSSDYLLQALALDPALTQKRLGDGFYEQRLIREQVAALTGLRFLGDYRDDEAQYQALMTAAATFAQAQPLRPGIALSAAQVAQLTSDIVWLVAETVILPDGSTTTALVPRVYLAPRTGDLAQNGQLFGTLFGGAQNGAQNTGSLISARDIQLSLSGDLNNSGTIAGRRLVDLSAQNITHSGLLQGDAVMLSARDDIRIDGGQVAAHSGMVLQAEGDITVQSTTQRSSNQAGGNTFSQQGIDRIAGLYVSGEAGVLLASAGNDIHLIAAQVRNAGTGATQLQAGGDLHLATVQTGQSHDITWNANHYHRQSSSTDVGTHITGGGAVSIQAQNDITARAAHVNAQGALNLQATDGNITIEAGQSSQSLAEAHQSRSRSTLGSRTTTTRSSSQSSTAQASELGGQTVNIQSGADTRIVGSNLLADQDLNIQAGGDLTIEAAQNTQSSSSFNQTRRSGVFGSGGIGFTIGSQQQSTDVQNQRISAAVSTVGAIDGNVNLNAGQTYTQTGSDVLAPGGDININAQRANIEEALETSSSQFEHKFKQSGLTVAITSPVIGAAQTINQQVQAAGNTQSSRMQALAAANVAYNAQQAANAIQAGQGQVPTGNKLPDGSQERVGGNAADKAGGIGINVSLGSSRSQSNSSQTSDTARGSSVTAGGDVNITASGGGANNENKSDITIQGSTIQAAGTTRLSAEDEVRLLAAANTTTQNNSQSSKSGSIGVGINLGAGGTNMGVTVSASRGTGQGAGDGTHYTQAEVSGQTVEITSGGDTTLKGAAVKAEQVTATVGGDLLIETLQDSNRYNERSRSVGGSVTFGPAPGGSLNLGQTRIHSHYRSATEPSGIRAGDGGFQVNVAGNTTLAGGVITSTESAVQAGSNQFTTAGQTAQEALDSGALTLSDLNNYASYSARSTSIGLGMQGGSIAPSGVGQGRDSGSASSTTRAGISGLAGDAEVRTGDAATGIGQIFDQARVQREVAAQVAITQEFGKQASKAVGDYAKIQYEQARAAGDTEGMAAWAEGGSHRVLLHTLVGGLTGGVQGAIGAGAASAAAPAIEALQEQLQTALADAGVGPDTANLIASLASAATAATIGAAASGGSTAGAATAFNADMNNRQLHPSERQLAQRIAEQLAREGITGADGQPYSAEQIEAQMRLMGVAGQTQPHTMEVLTSPEAIAQARQNDPNLPLMFQGPAAVEPLGQPNWDLQQHIISRSTPHPDVPSIYLPSVSAPTAPITPSATPNATARCANGDLACITGVGQQQNAPISAESVANSAAQLSRQAGVVAAGATLATAQASPHVKPITGAVAVGATVIGVAADVVEQLARPDVGQAVVNLIGTTAVEAANKAVPIAAPITNEVVELLKNTNKAGEIRDGSNKFIEEIKR